MAARLRLRTGQFRKYVALKGWSTDKATAIHIGVDPTQLSRVLRGVVSPGEHFIAGTLAAFPELTFEDLFTVETGDGERAA
jgi:hypothetical protein